MAKSYGGMQIKNLKQRFEERFESMSFKVALFFHKLYSPLFLQ